MKPASSWTKLRRNTAQLSVLLVRMLQDDVKYRGADTVEHYRLGRLTLECLGFRRRLLEKRPGPKWSEEKRLERMEKKVGSIMARLDKRNQKE